MTDRLRKLPFGRAHPFVARVQTLYPGVLLAVVIGLAAFFLSDHYGAPVMLMALLIGMALNSISTETPVSDGINFSTRTLLRTGVALLGVRVSVADIASIGFSGLAAIAGLLVATIAMGVLLSRRDWQFGVLTGGAVAICGASAALAISSCLPKGKLMEKETLFTVVTVTALSTLAMIFYPIILVELGFAERQIAFVLGASIHDVAQVVGAGMTVSPDTAELATLVKMVRVSLLPVVLAVLMLTVSLTGGKEMGRKPQVPPFLIAFFLLALGANLGLFPEQAIALIAVASKWLLITAIAALGVKTSLLSLSSVGSDKLVRVVFMTLVLFGASALLALHLPGLAAP